MANSVAVKVECTTTSASSCTQAYLVNGPRAVWGESARDKRHAAREDPSDIFAATRAVPLISMDDIDAEVGVSTPRIYSKMREIEMIGQIFDPSCKYIKYRRLLVDWMCEVGERFNLHNSTVHVAVGYFDRLLQKISVSRSRLYLVAIACIVVAGKYEEAEERLPAVKDLIAACPHQYTTQAVSQMEIITLTQFDPEDTMYGKPLQAKVPRYVKKYLDFFSDLCLQDYRFQRHKPSVLASAIVLTARRALNVFPIWREELEAVLHYTYEEMKDCYLDIWQFYRDSFPKEAKSADDEQRRTHAAMNADCSSAGIESAEFSPSGVADA